MTTPLTDNDRVATAPQATGLLWFIQACNRFFFAPADPLPLGVIRICTGLLILYIHLVYSFDLLALMGPQGWVDKATIDHLRLDTTFAAPQADWWYEASNEPYAVGYQTWSVYFHLTDTSAIITVHVLFLLAMALFTAGFATRVTSVVSWIAMMSYIQRAPTTLFGMDTMMNILMIYLMIAPCGATLSVDRWLQCWWARRRGEQMPPVEPSVSANFTLRLMQIHFCFIYMMAGWSKLQGSAWWNYTAMWGTMANYEFAPMNWGFYHAFLVWLCQHRILWELVCTGGCLFTIMLEIYFPVLVWVKQTRWLMIAGAVLLHTGIGLIMGLATFSLLMMTLVLSFVPAETMHSLVDRLSGGLRRAPGILYGKPSEAEPANPMLTAQS